MTLPQPLEGRRIAFQRRDRGSCPASSSRALLTPINDTACAAGRPGRRNGIRNGLYSIHIRMLDGIDGGNTGVMVLQDGRIRGGDAFFDYIGAYSAENGKWKGEIVNHEHTPSRGERPLFGGHEVGIGFSGTYDGEGAEGEATALAGKRSIRFKAVLKKTGGGLLNPSADRDQRAGDGAGGVAGQEQDHLGEFLRPHPFGEIGLRHAGAVGRGIDGRRQHRIDGDLALELGGERFGEPVHARLRRRIRTHAGAGLQGAHRADIDDARRPATSKDAAAPRARR